MLRSHAYALPPLLVLLLAPILTPDLSGQGQRFVIEMRPGAGGNSKLAKELEAARLLRGTFLGFTAQGYTVVEVGARTTLKQAERTLGRLPGLRRVRALMRRAFRPVDRFHVFQVRGQQAPALPKVERVRGRGSVATFVEKGGVSLATLDALAGSAAVRRVEPNYPYRLDRSAGIDRKLEPDDGQFGLQWALQKIHAPMAWDVVTTSPVIVAVLDTGIDTGHPDLSPNLWEGPGGIHGYNFYDDNTDVSDKDGHGTACAGILGAAGNNGVGIAGVAWAVQIMAVKIFENGSDGADHTVIADAIRYAVDQGAKVLNNSWSGPYYSEYIHEAVIYANSKGSLMICSAGNGDASWDPVDTDFYPVFPAGHLEPNVIAVMGSDENDLPVVDSNFGKLSVDLAAPGEFIYTTYRGSSYITDHGTSMATPFVSGAFALAWGTSKYADATHSDLVAAVLGGVTFSAQLVDRCQTSGRLDLAFLNPTAIAAGTDDEREPGGGERQGQSAKEGEGGTKPVQGEDQTQQTPSNPEAERKFTGTVVCPAFVLRGSTTGVHLRCPDGVIQLDCTKLTGRKMKALNGHRIEVTGTLRTVAGSRRILTVCALRRLPPPDKPGAKKKSP